MSTHAQLLLYLGLAVVGAVGLCFASARVLLNRGAKARDRRHYWYAVDLAYYVLGGLAFFGVATNLITGTYIQSRQNDLARAVSSEYQALRLMVGAAVRDAARVRGALGAAPAQVEQSQAAIDWFGKVDPAVHYQATREGLNRLVDELNQGPSDFSTLPSAALAKQQVLSAFDRIQAYQAESDELRNFPEILKATSLNWWLAFLTFVTGPITLGTRFAKVIAEAHGLTRDAEPAAAARSEPPVAGST